MKVGMRYCGRALLTVLIVALPVAAHDVENVLRAAELLNAPPQPA